MLTRVNQCASFRIKRVAFWKRSVLILALALFVSTLAMAADRPLLDIDALVPAEDGTLPLWEAREFAVYITVTDDPALVSSGKQALAGKLAAEAEGNKRAMIMWMPPADEQDWTAVRGIFVDVFNPNEQALRIGFAIQTGDAWRWQEVGPVALPPGWTKDIYYPFDEHVWKSSNTGWAYVAKAEDVADVRGINFLIVAADEGEYDFVLDNIRVRE